MEDSRFEELLDRYRLGDISPAELAELEQILRTDAARRRMFVEDSLFEANLRETHSAAVSPPLGQEKKAKPPTRRTRRHASVDPKPSWGVWVLAAAAIFGVVTLVVVLGPSDPDSAAPLKAADARSRATREAAAQRQAERDRQEREREEARAEAERRGREAEARLREIEENRKLLTQATPEPKEDPQAKEKREQKLADLKRDQERVEQELRQAAELAKKSAPQATPATPTEEKPPAPGATPAGPSQGTTRAAIAQIEEVAGDAFRVSKEGKLPLAVGENVFVAEGLQTGAGPSRIVFRFPDNTRVELGPATVMSEVTTNSGKRLAFSEGAVRAVVAKQPKEQPMLLLSPQGQARVVGTTLRLVIDPDPQKGTRLEVEEGKVELKNLAGKTVLVESGHYAVAAAGAELVAKPLTSDEILLFPWQAHLVGGEWALAPDSAAQGGTSLFSRKTSYQIRMVGANRDTSVYSGVKGRPSYVQFTFFAEGSKDYWVWLRGKSLPEDANHTTTAEVAAEFPSGQLNPQNTPIAIDKILGGDRAHNFTGFFKFPGFGWIGGNGEHPEQGKVDEVPLSLRFPRSGMQTLKLHAIQAPAWIDAIWISATQRTRPDARATGPAGK
jgi:hypothetical protein